MSERSAHSMFEVTDLSVRYARGEAPVLRDVSLTIDRGESIALVGDSGCGKSTLALAAIRLLPKTACIRGSIVLRGDHRAMPVDILGSDERAIERVRGRRIAMVFQDPIGSLNPVMRIEKQLAEVLRVVRGASRSTARRAALESLDRVGIADPIRVGRAYPHELSGGMAQRVALALALAGEPELLIADEPTSALDGIVQAQIVELIRETQRQTNLSLLLITHDMAIAKSLANRVCVIEANRLVDDCPIDQLTASNRHAATKRLIQAAEFKRSAAITLMERTP